MKLEKEYVKIYIFTYLFIGLFYFIFETNVNEYYIFLKEDIYLIIYNFLFRDWEFKTIISIINGFIGSTFLNMYSK